MVSTTIWIQLLCHPYHQLPCLWFCSACYPWPGEEASAFSSSALGTGVPFISWHKRDWCRRLVGRWWETRFAARTHRPRASPLKALTCSSLLTSSIQFGFYLLQVSLHQVLLVLELCPEPLYTLLGLWQPDQFWPNSFASSLFTIDFCKLSPIYLGTWWSLFPEESEPWPCPLPYLTLALHWAPYPDSSAAMPPPTHPIEHRCFSEWEINLSHSSG